MVSLKGLLEEPRNGVRHILHEARTTQQGIPVFGSLHAQYPSVSVLVLVSGVQGHPTLLRMY